MNLESGSSQPYIETKRPKKSKRLSIWQILIGLIILAAAIVTGVWIVFVGLGLLALILTGFLRIYQYFSKEKREERRLVNEERKRQRAEAIRVWQLRLEEAKQLELTKYQELRQAIQRMPKYQHWRNEVLEKYGRRCAVGGETDNLEVHHRKSFGSIIRLNNISTPMQAFECNELWDVNNGSVLCGFHHEQTKSYQYRNKKITGIAY